MVISSVQIQIDIIWIVFKNVCHFNKYNLIDSGENSNRQILLSVLLSQCYLFENERYRNSSAQVNQLPSVRAKTQS